MKYAIVIGGSGSIGASIVRALGKQGTGRRSLDKQPLPIALEALAGYIEVDLRDPQLSRAAVDAACREFEGLDVLVYCAGVLGPTCPFEAAPLRGASTT